MLEIKTISAFLNLTLEQQTAIAKSLKSKERLEDWQRAVQAPDYQPPYPVEVRWVPCKCTKAPPEDQGTCAACGRPKHYGWKLNPAPADERDNSGVHPSGLDKCAKHMWLSCTGESQKQEKFEQPRLRRIFDLGSCWHIAMQDWYGERGAWGDPRHYHKEVSIAFEAVNADGTPVHPVATKYWIKGHCDALLDPYITEVPGIGTVGVRVVHEYKTINSAGFAKLTGPQTKHIEQATTYAACLDAPLTVYFYLNKDDSNLQDFVIPFAPKVWETTIKKIEVVQAWVNGGKTPPWEHTSAILSPRECVECGYRRICQPPAQQMPNIRR